MGQDLPLLLSAALGKKVNRPPVWMMRQAGRYMKIYRDLRERYPSFRERSENPELSYEISMQPFHAFKPDGVILFSDILTPLPGMGINFEIIESKGPIIEDPIRTLNQVENLRELNPSESLSFVGQVLSSLKKDVNNEATVLGFVGAPWTLAAYVVEGKSSKNYSLIKSMAFNEPDLLHKLLDHFAKSIGEYLKYQIKSGAQVVQIFDSWAGIGIQGNVDPGILFGNKESIKERIDNTFNKIKDRKYILNLGHGILPGTPEENAQTFFEHGKKLTY